MQQSQTLCPTAPGAASGSQDVFHWGRSWGLSVTPSLQGLSLRSSCFLGKGARVRGATRRHKTQGSSGDGPLRAGEEGRGALPV